jgi:hypothetical protein
VTQAPPALVLDQVVCRDCGTRIDAAPPVPPGSAASHVHRWSWGTVDDGPGRRPRRRARRGWLRAAEWWLNTKSAADPGGVNGGPLTHPPEQRCWSSYCAHCAGPPP